LQAQSNLWWHHIGASGEDRRQYKIVEPINRWHEVNQEYLVDREPVASVGLMWSEQNTDYFGVADSWTIDFSAQLRHEPQVAVKCFRFRR
jgi:hypothetical protein